MCANKALYAKVCDRNKTLYDALIDYDQYIILPEPLKRVARRYGRAAQQERDLVFPDMFTHDQLFERDGWSIASKYAAFQYIFGLVAKHARMWWPHYEERDLCEQFADASGELCD